MTTSGAQQIRLDSQFGFFDRSIQSDQVRHPLLISNEDENTMLAAILRELHRSQRFVFSVAFIRPGALASLKQALLDFRGQAEIITSTYLQFNSPDAFRELLALPNVRTYVYPEAAGGFHAKGYLFEQQDGTTAIVGSSNLTPTALERNQEWNIRFSALPDGDITQQLWSAVQRQLSTATPLTADWIAAYEATWLPPAPVQRRESVEAPDPSTLALPTSITPNAMQREALEQIQAVRDAGEKRAVVISATGTGKTILSALDVRAARPERMLFLVHREQILDKAIEAFQSVLGAPEHEFGKFVGSRRDLDAKYLFATVQSLSRRENLKLFNPEHFDYILIDEVHRAAASSYRQVIDHFVPGFLLGLTATPERTDGFNVFELFDYNVPYEIRLQAALEAEMLAPFHYYGVTEYTDSDGITVDAVSDLKHLTANARIDHLLKTIQVYGQPGARHGLIFCSRKDETHELSRLLNERVVRGQKLRTRALTGDDSADERNSAIIQLEAGELDYILTVDVFNEGIDIPCVNEVIMLRQTQSSIIFTQQLGRGLRKAPNKENLRVIDFIGNYANNYLIPIALIGDASLNKDAIRKKLSRAIGNGSIAGLSSISFDEISRARVLESLATVRLDSMGRLKESFIQLEQRLGGTPKLIDFARFDAVDPVVMATKAKNYWSLLNKFKRETTEPNQAEASLLNFLSAELLNGKRPHELILLRRLLTQGPVSKREFRASLVLEGCQSDQATVDSSIRILTLEFFTESERRKYGDRPLVTIAQDLLSISDHVQSMLQASPKLRAHVTDVIETGLYLARHRYSWTGSLEAGQMYSRKDVCRLLNWRSNEYSTIYGYKVDRVSSSCPIFVTYHKGEEVSASTQYEDELLDPTTMKWFTRNKRTLQSKEVDAIVKGEVPLYLFVKKDDAEGNDFHFLGKAQSRDARQEKIPAGNGDSLDIVSMKLGLEAPMEDSLFQYLTKAPLQVSSS